MLRSTWDAGPKDLLRAQTSFHVDTYPTRMVAFKFELLQSIVGSHVPGSVPGDGDYGFGKELAIWTKTSKPP